MVVTYEVNTQYIGTARDIAIRRAISEGWTKATVMNIQKFGDATYEVTLTVFK